MLVSWFSFWYEINMDEQLGKMLVCWLCFNMDELVCFVSTWMNLDISNRLILTEPMFKSLRKCTYKESL
jgi:hypothetical protein